ncbi:MAG: Adenine deaminase, partial [Anaerolineales bacterium]|nr:Adenine deaminase [Anaerolineales bacterium]
EVVARKAEAVLAEYRACGCHLHNANMQLSLLALVVIRNCGFQIWGW